jgi:hypothetical protein
MVTDERATAEDLAVERKQHRGQWIAIKDNRVIDAASNAADLIDRLVTKGESGWVLDRVPEDPDTVFIL